MVCMRNCIRYTVRYRLLKKEKKKMKVSYRGGGGREGVVEESGYIVLTGSVLYHVKCCIRLTALLFFYHIP